MSFELLELRKDHHCVYRIHGQGKIESVQHTMEYELTFYRFPIYVEQS
jgi:hypothetical protein